MVARDGIEPPPPAFSGFGSPESPKWFRIKRISLRVKDL